MHGWVYGMHGRVYGMHAPLPREAEDNDCSVVFDFRSSSSLGVPFCGWGSLGLGFGGAGACLCWLGLGLPLACPFASPYL